MKNDYGSTRGQRFATHLLTAIFLTAGCGFAEASFAADKETPSSRASEIRMSVDRVTLPIVMVREFPFIEGSVSGVPGKFMLDTGIQDALSINSHRIPVANAQTVDRAIFGSGKTFDIKTVPVVNNTRGAGVHYKTVTRVNTQDALQLERITPDFSG